MLLGKIYTNTVYIYILLLLVLLFVYIYIIIDCKYIHVDNPYCNIWKGTLKLDETGREEVVDSNQISGWKGSLEQFLFAHKFLQAERTGSV